MTARNVLCGQTTQMRKRIVNPSGVDTHYTVGNVKMVFNLLIRKSTSVDTRILYCGDCVDQLCKFSNESNDLPHHCAAAKILL